MTFKPNYKITPIITKYIGLISAAREAILDSPLLPKIEKQLRKEALISRSHHSTSIEGNRLSKEQVAKIVSGGQVEARPKDKREVLNYVAALEFIDKQGRVMKKMTPAVILKLHQLIAKGILEKNQTGEFRNKMVYVVDGLGQTVFTPPAIEQVTGLIKDLTDWLNSKEAKDLYPVLTAGIAHYEFVRIHPFMDGNGRVARALATLLLYQLDFDIKDFFALDDYYNENRPAYYAALQSVDPASVDITQWLEYFVEGVAKQMAGIKEKIQKLSRNKLLIKKEGQIWLNERQWSFMEFLTEAKTASMRDYLALFEEGKVSERTIRLDLDFLSKKGLISKIGKGPATRYRLNY